MSICALLGRVRDVLFVVSSDLRGIWARAARESHLLASSPPDLAVCALLTGLRNLVRSRSLFRKKAKPGRPPRFHYTRAEKTSVSFLKTIPSVDGAQRGSATA